MNAGLRSAVPPFEAPGQKNACEDGRPSALPQGPLTYGRHDGAHEVEGAGEVPAQANIVHADAGLGGLLVVAKEAAQLVAAQVVAAAEVSQALLPALLGLAFVRQLQRREDGGAAQQVEHDERGEQQEARVVLVQVARAAAAAATPAGHGQTPGGSPKPGGRVRRLTVARAPREVGSRPDTQSAPGRATASSPMTAGRSSRPRGSRGRRVDRSCSASPPRPPRLPVSNPHFRRRPRPPRSSPKSLRAE